MHVSSCLRLKQLSPPTISSIIHHATHDLIWLLAGTTGRDMSVMMRVMTDGISKNVKEEVVVVVAEMQSGHDTDPKCSVHPLFYVASPNEPS